MELRDWLTGVVADPSYKPEIREEATRILEVLRSGIIPSWSAVEKLRDRIDDIKPGVCTNLLFDGACDWLREEGASHGLPVAARGERCMCAFPNAWMKCPGYVKE